MEIIIHGTGTMSKILNSLALTKNIKVNGMADELQTETGDVIIDFSHYSRLDSLLDFALRKKIPLVIATTGYSADILNKIKEYSNEIPILLSSNMSLGINLILDILDKIVPTLYKEYDIEIIEKHHNKKIDSPSGTAKTLLEAVERNCAENMKKVYGREGIEAREKNEIGIHAIRGGTVVGEHSVMFYGNDEIIEINHTALSKKIFAEGALKAAEFLISQKPGLYTMKDIFNNN